MWGSLTKWLCIGRASGGEHVLKQRLTSVCLCCRTSSWGERWSGVLTMHTLRWLWMACVITFCQLYLVAERNLAFEAVLRMHFMIFFSFSQVLLLFATYLTGIWLACINVSPSERASLYVVSGSLSNDSIIKWGKENNLKNQSFVEIVLFLLICDVYRLFRVPWWSLIGLEHRDRVQL